MSSLSQVYGAWTTFVNGIKSPNGPLFLCETALSGISNIHKEDAFTTLQQKRIPKLFDLLPKLPDIALDRNDLAIIACSHPKFPGVDNLAVRTQREVSRLEYSVDIGSQLLKLVPSDISDTS